MSVKSKMTAIADKIRALLGISGTMGLDAMSTNLATIQTDISSAFTAVGNKGGTVPSSKVSGNLASAINSIPAGVTVQRASGSVSLTSSAKTVNCGFQPDAIFFTLNNTYTDSGTTYQYGTGIFFSEMASGRGYDCVMYDSDFKYSYEFWGKQTTSGFTAAYQRETLSNGSLSSESKSFNYVAIKYT